MLHEKTLKIGYHFLGYSANHALPIKWNRPKLKPVQSETLQSEITQATMTPNSSVIPKMEMPPENLWTHVWQRWECHASLQGFFEAQSGRGTSIKAWH